MSRHTVRGGALPCLVFVIVLGSSTAFAQQALLKAVHGQEPGTPPGAPQALTSGAASVAKAPADAALPSFRVYIGDTRVGIAAVRALHLAAERLARPDCQGLLREFTDATGRPLADRLTALRMSADAYLRLIVVVDGGHLRPCMGTVGLAFTTSGSRVVYLCGASFATKLQDNPLEATLTIIHELLHSLGLGENPPSSEAISQRVRERCW
jgi:hypothetical protein